MTDNFKQKLLSSLAQSCYEYQDNNTDYSLFGSGLEAKIARLRQQLVDKILQLASRIGFFKKPQKFNEQLNYLIDNLEKFEKFYYLLHDEYSKKVLIEILKLRVLTWRHVRLPLENKTYWTNHSSISRYLKKKNVKKSGVSWLSRYKLSEENGSVELDCNTMSVLDVFLLNQYSYRRGSISIQVNHGDIVIDGGGCWGDTTLYFANKTGSNGKVYCFEFLPENIEILQNNLSMNLQLANRVKVIQKAIWDKSDEKLSFSDSGPGTRIQINSDDNLHKVSTLSIDDFVNQEHITKVDFIKLDIEGSEMRALYGAEKTLQTFKPMLAIAGYHGQDDLITISSYLSNLVPEYKFFIDHLYMYENETILFAGFKCDVP